MDAGRRANAGPVRPRGERRHPPIGAHLPADVAATLAVSLLLATGVGCLRLLPEQAHVKALITMRPRADPEVRYETEEFVDRTNFRSSISLSDKIKGGTVIFYNQLRPGEKDYGSRKFMAYNTDSMTCSEQHLLKWPLRQIRFDLIFSLPSESLSKDLVDIALGPSALLRLLDVTANEFIFKGNAFDDVRLSNVELYERQYAVGYDENLVFVVRIGRSSEPGSVASEGSTLGSLVEPQGGAPPKRRLQPLELFSMLVCRMNDEALKERAETKEQRCKSADSMYEVDFHLVGELSPGTLLGRDLTHTSLHYEFSREPFMQPTGIGCWRADLDSSLQKRLMAPKWATFSGTYWTTNGSDSLGFVAYDSKRRSLRWDHDGLRTLHDLSRRKSYFVKEKNFQMDLPAPKGTPVVMDSAQLDRECVALETQDENFEPSSMLERLLGVGPADAGGQFVAYFIGSRLIDHAVYDVYEMELTFGDGTSALEGYNVPLLLQPSAWSTPSYSFERTRFYLTYYVRGSDGRDGARDDNADDEDPLEADPEPPLLHFIELWLFSVELKQKTFMNRLMFDDFAWSLAVEPPIVGVQPAKTGLAAADQVFIFDECANKLNQQVRITYSFILDSTSDITRERATLLPVFRAHLADFEEVLRWNLINVFGLSQLQLLRHEALFRPANSTSLVVRARVADLTSGQSREHLLGYGFFDTLLKLTQASLLAFGPNTRSEDECRALAATQGTPVEMVWCKSIAVCAVLAHGSMHQHRVVLEAGSPFMLIRNNNPHLAKCLVSSFAWAPTPEGAEESLLKRIQAQRFKLVGNQIKHKFHFPAPAPLASRTSVPTPTHRLVTVRGFAHSVSVRGMAGWRAGWGDGSAAQVGVRFTTKLEEPALFNSNEPVELAAEGARPAFFAKCNAACQLDESCQTFSVCLRPRNGQSPNANPRTDCILSTARLDGDHLRELAKQVRNIQTNPTLKQTMRTFDLRVSNELMSQELRFHFDSDCSLHAKNVLASYAMTTPFNSSMVEGANGKMAPDGRARPGPRVGLRGESLEVAACAELTDRASRDAGSPVAASFAYCPLASDEEGGQCYARFDFEQQAWQLAPNQLCYLYEKSYSHLYRRRAYSRMRLLLAGERSATETAEAGARAAKATLERLGLARWLDGLSAEQCARDCSLRQSGCMAFDHCQFDVRNQLCILYRLRSPLAHMFAPKDRTEYLEFEKPFYKRVDGQLTGDSATIIASLDCHHNYLSDIYFELRLGQLLNAERRARRDPATTLAPPTAPRRRPLPPPPPPPLSQDRAKMEQAERAILEHDQAQADAELESYLSGLAEQAREEADKAAAAAAAAARGWWLWSLVRFSLGAGFGAGLVICAESLSLLATSQIDALRHRYGSRRASQLTLANNLQL